MFGLTIRQQIPLEDIRLLCLISRTLFEKMYGVNDYYTYVHEGYEMVTISHSYYDEEHVDEFNNELIHLTNKMDLKYPMSYPDLNNVNWTMTFVNMNKRNYMEIPSIVLQPDATFEMYNQVETQRKKGKIDTEALKELFINKGIDESYKSILEPLLKNIKNSAFVSMQLKQNIASAVFNVCGGPLDVLPFEYNSWTSWTKAPSQHGLKYLIKLAYKHDPSGTSESLRSNVNYLVEKSLSIDASDREIAMVLYVYTVGKYVKSPTSWYFYQGAYWREIENPTNIRIILGETVRSLYRAFKNDLLNKDKKEKLGKITKIIQKLGEQTYKNNVIKELGDMLYDREFELKLNTKRHLFSFNNKIYDTLTGEVRDGNPNDFLSKTAGYDYEDFSWDHEDVQWWFKTFIDKVYPPDYFTFNGSKVYTKEGYRIKHDIGQKVYKYPRSELEEGIQQIELGTIDDCEPCFESRDWSLRRYGISLGNGALMKDMVITVGRTNGGKSMQDKILRMMHGEWAANFPHGLLFDDKVLKGNAHGPTTGWESVRDAKYASITEPPKGAKMVSSIIKLLVSGGVDGIFSRDCNQKAKDAVKKMIVIHAMIEMWCNDIPLVDGDDSAIQDRLWIREFEMVFDRYAPKDPTLQKINQHYPRDEMLSMIAKQKIAAWTWIIIQYHKKYLKDKQLITPEIVKLRTKMYLVHNDPIQMFINETLKTTPRNNKTYAEYINECRDIKISSFDLYKTYMAWFQQKYNDKDKPLPIDEFKKQLINKNFILEKKSYIGIEYK